MLNHYPTPLRGGLAFIFSRPFNRRFTLWLLLAGSPAALGQTITGSAPQMNAVAAPVTTDVTLMASSPFLGAAPTAIRVFSRQAGGSKAGIARISGTTLIFNPAVAFKPGETVFTTYTAPGSLTKSHVFGFTTAAAPSSGTFSGTTNVTVGDQPDCVTAADVDGDGDLDILVANVVSLTVNVLVNDGSGAFSSGTVIAVGSHPRGLAAADVDGDGDLDILTAHGNSERGNVNVQFNNGSGSFGGTAEVSVGTIPTSVAAADVDGDGDLDILTTSWNSGAVSVRLNNGLGAFSGTTALQAGGGTGSVAAADVDGDGDLDILTANADDDNVSILLNNGSGSFSAATNLVVGDYPRSVAAADMDGDGDLDILTANELSSSVSVRLNNGSGSFSAATNLVVGGRPTSVAAADVDGDGDLDILAANGFFNNYVSVRINNGSGSFSAAANLVVGGGPSSVAAADVDGDGDLDILTANTAGDYVSVRLNGPVLTLSPIHKAAKEDVAVSFSASDFTNAFSGGSLSKVKITSLPVAATGVLKVNGVNVTPNQEIATADLADLTFVPAAQYNGSASFNWNGTEGNVYAASDATVHITLAAVNDAPSFVGGADQTAPEDAGLQTVTGWATAISKGPGDESSQTIDFHVTNNNNGLFSTQPAIADDGTLTYAPAANAFGLATVSVNIKDNGGTANSGVDASSLQTFTITIDAVNDAPSFTKGAGQTVPEDAGPQTVAAWATAISKGPANESAQTIDFLVTSSNTGLFSTQPAVSDNGTLTYTPAANANGVATLSVKLKDNGGTANGGKDESAAQTFTIAVTAVNDAPTFVIADDPAPVNEDAGAQTVTAFAASLEDGDPEVNQTLTFTITANSNGALFSVAPAIASNGTLTYTPAADANGTALLKVTLSDNGSDSDPDVNTSTEKTFTITVTAVNDAPGFTKGAGQEVNEDAGPQTVAAWATAISKGPGDESAQTIDFVVTSSNTGLFSTQPAVSDNGTLTYTPAANANGVATLSVKLKDNGGTANGGKDESATQTFTIAVTAVNDAPVVLATPASQQVQYSDRIAPVTISATDVDNDLNGLTAATSWKLTSASGFTAGLPDALSFSQTSAGSWTLSGRTMLAPGTYTVRITVSDGTASASNNRAFTDIELIVVPEDARATYTGAFFAATASASSGKATVTLSATLQDISALTADPAYDSHAGDIRNARVKFVNRDNGSDLSGWLTPGLVTASDLKTGTVTFNWAVDIGAKSYETFTVGIVVNHYYARNAAGENTTVNVARPLGEFITGGGALTLTNASGLIQPRQGSKNNFGFNVKYTKSGTNLQGNLNTIIRSENGKVYQVKGNVMTSLAVDIKKTTAHPYPTAVFNGKANIQDITNPLAPLSVDGNATLQVTMTDAGEPGSSDKIAITVWNKAGGLWFASHWSGNRTTEQLLSGGNLKVSSKTSFGATPTARTAAGTAREEVAGELAVEAYPNPVFDKLTLRIPGHLTGELALTVTDPAGVPLSRQVVEALPAGQALSAGERKVEIDFSGQAPGLYLLQVQAGSRHRVLKVVKLLR